MKPDGLEPVGRNPSGAPGRSMYTALLFCCLALLLMKLPSLQQPHRETDELVYLSLAYNLAETGRYTLQGTPILKHLSPGIYDRPLFQHPPLFVLLAAPLVAVFGPNAPVVISWLGHVLVLFAVYLLLARFLAPSQWPVAALCLVFVTLDPLLVFIGQKIWLDSLLAGLAALAAALFLTARENGSWRCGRLIFAGLVQGLAVLTKLPALLSLPVLAVVYWQKKVPGRRKALVHGLCFLVPFLVLVLPWFATFYSCYGQLLPGWMAPDGWLMGHSGFTSYTGKRPVYFYLQELLLLSPVLALCLYLVRRPRRMGFPALLLAGWAALVLSAMTWLAVAGGYTFQMRYVAMAYAPLYVLLGLILSRLEIFRRPALLVPVLLAFAVQAMTGFYHVVNSKYDAVTSLLELVLGL